MGDAAVMCVCPEGFSGVKCEIAERGNGRRFVRVDADGHTMTMMGGRQRGFAHLCQSIVRGPFTAEIREEEKSSKGIK